MPPKPKIGEGIVVVMDVGRSVCGSTDDSFFVRSKNCLRFMLQRKIFADKCYDVVGIVLFGTAGTDNQLATGDEYQHVTVLQEVRLVDWEMMKQVEGLGGGGSCGDWLDAMVVAMDLLHDPHGKRFTAKRIVLLTDFSGEFSNNQSTTITSGLLNERIELVVIGLDIMATLDEEDGDAQMPGPSDGEENSTPQKSSLNWNGKPKTVVQKAGEALVSRMVSKIDGILCSFEDALPQLMFFDQKKQSSAFWNTTLDIGTDVKIPISGKIQVREVSLPSWKKTYAADPSATITQEVSYHLYDENQTVVPAEDVISGFFYGSTLVPVSDEDMKMAYKSNSPRSMTVLGFTESSNVHHWIRTGNQVLSVTARENDETAAVALSALIQAMMEADMVAITRRVYSQNMNPRLGVLFPEISKDYECLLWIQLPFAQDVVSVSCPSLQPRIEKLKDEEKAAIDSLIDAMDLSHVKGEDGEEDEDENLLDPTRTLNPVFQHYYNTITHRALNPGTILPEPPPHVLKILEPPARVCGPRDKVAEKLKVMFPTVLPPPEKTKNVFDGQDEDNERPEKRARVDDGVCVRDLLEAQVTRVTSASPVKDFMALLRSEAPNFNDICKQMGDVILQLVNSLPGITNEAVAAAARDKVVDCLTTYRRESCSIDPATYNRFLTTTLKNAVVYLSMKDLWTRMKEADLGLIVREESGRSSVGREEATTFLQLDQSTEEAPPPPVQETKDDMEDLLDDL